MASGFRLFSFFLRIWNLIRNLFTAHPIAGILYEKKIEAQFDPGTAAKQEADEISKWFLREHTSGRCEEVFAPYLEISDLRTHLVKTACLFFDLLKRLDSLLRKCEKNYGPREDGEVI